MQSAVGLEDGEEEDQEPANQQPSGSGAPGVPSEAAAGKKKGTGKAKVSFNHSGMVWPRHRNIRYKCLQI